MTADLKITTIQAFPTSFPLPPEKRVSLGIGTAVKRDAVVVKVSTAGGLTGWGEAHHGRAHSAVAKLIETTLKQLILGMDAADVVGVWAKIYKMQLGSHGMGAATCLAMSGIDLALWDIRGQAAGMPLYKLLGGARKGIPAYAGGVSLGYQDPAKLVEEVRPLRDRGYKAIKLRVGDTPKLDLARIEAVRSADCCPPSAGRAKRARQEPGQSGRRHGRGRRNPGERTGAAAIACRRRMYSPRPRPGRNRAGRR